jgi:hypothetical protein
VEYEFVQEDGTLLVKCSKDKSEYRGRWGGERRFLPEFLIAHFRKVMDLEMEWDICDECDGGWVGVVFVLV